ncbi:MAG TPA: sigma factor, partial [Desulfuromonadaceae bacterium]|nr:sigma factor [Desulfuromonadaceae bacterium]
MSAQSTQAIFATTHWSVVLMARDKGLPGSAVALEELCRVYWYPLYAYVRRSGHSREDAEDLVQAFFARLLDKNYLEAVVPERGRFRNFMLVALKRFLANEWDRKRAQKRGGGIKAVSLDVALAESKLEADLVAGDLSPERIYERRWALTLLEQTM